MNRPTVLRAPRVARLLRALGLCALLCALPIIALSQPPLSPSQAAFLKAENKRIEDYFVSRVANIVQVSPERVRQAMPDERRITVTVSRLMAVLERDLGQGLSDAQRAAIMAADDERRQALARVREGASRR